MVCRCQYQHASDKTAFGRCGFSVRLRGRVAVVVVDMKLRLACLDRNQTSEQLPASQPSIQNNACYTSSTHLANSTVL